MRREAAEHQPEPVAFTSFRATFSFRQADRADGTIIVKLQSLQYGELQVVPDSSGVLQFLSTRRREATQSLLTPETNMRSSEREFLSILI